MIRVLVSAKSAITRAGLASLVRADGGFEVVCDDCHYAEVGRALRQLVPDVVLLDCADGELPHGVQAGDSGAPALVLLVDGPTRSRIRRLLQMGVRGIVQRECSPAEITGAMHAAAAGLAVVSRDVLDALLPVTTRPDDLGDLPLGEPLTSRESEVLSMLAEGAGNKELATRLHISEHTVKFHVSSILAKLGAETRTEAVSLGYREGLIVM